MALEQVLEGIKRDADAERKALEAESKEVRSKALALAKEAVEEYRKKALERASRDSLRMATQEAAFTELELKREQLQMERELTERVLHLAEERLRSLPRERNEAILKALLSHFEKEGVQVQAAPKDELFVKIATRLKFAGPLAGHGGLVITNAEATVLLDLTYETLMRDLSERMTKEVHQRMFAGSA